MWLLLFLLPALARARKLYSMAEGEPPASPASAKLPLAFAKLSSVTGRPIRSASLMKFIPASANSLPDELLPELSPIPPKTKPSRLCFTKLVYLWRIASLTLVCGTALALSILSFQAMKGETLYMQAVNSAHSKDKISLLRQSLQWNPRNPITAAVLSRMLPGNEGRDLLLESLNYSPANALLNWELAKRALGGNHPGLALYGVRRSQQLDNFNASKRIEAAEGMLAMSVRTLRGGDGLSASRSAEAGLELLRQYRLLAQREGSKGMQHNDRRFGNGEEAAGLYLRLSEARSEARHYLIASRL